MKMEQTECSETSAYKIQTLENYPEENIQHTEHDESLKSKRFYVDKPIVVLRSGTKQNIRAAQVTVLIPHSHPTAPVYTVVMLVLLMQGICKVWKWEGSLWHDIYAQFNERK